MDRRDWLRQVSALALTPLTTPMLAPASAAGAVMPTLFFAHGAPFLARDKERGAALAAVAAQLPQRPRGIVAITPHVRAEYVTIAASGRARHSFPRRFSERVGALAYTPPPATTLAAQVRAALAATGQALAAQPHRAFNHTVWMGLWHMFPQADVPVVEIAMPFRAAPELFRLGKALAALRNDGVLIVASGSLTHNLASLFVESTPSWATEFDAWIAETLAVADIDAVIDWRHKAPAPDVAHPDDGAHFNVLLYALGAAVGGAGYTHALSYNAGFEFGSFSTRDYLFA